MIDWENAKPSDFRFKLKADAVELGDSVTYPVLVIHKATDETVCTLPVQVRQMIDVDLRRLPHPQYMEGLSKIIATEVREYLKTLCGKPRMDIKTRITLADSAPVDLED